MRFTYPTALVFLALERGYRHGFDIIDATGLGAGTVYPILRRLEESGCVASEWEAAKAAREKGRPPRRYYALTGEGRATAREAMARYPGVAGALGTGGQTASPETGP